MNKLSFCTLIISSLLFLNSCEESPTAHIQGVYELDKEAFKNQIIADVGEESEFLTSILEMAVDKAKVELRIKEDSLIGLLFMMEDVTLMETKISLRNDTLIVQDGDTEAYLIETEGGLSFRSPDSELGLELKKAKQTELTDETLAMMRDKKNSLK